MSDQIKSERQSETGNLRLCTGFNIVYRAFSRPYMGNGAPVLTLLASVEYSSAPWELHFEAVYGTANEYKLLEKVPGVVFYLYNYPSVTYSSDYGLEDLGDTVTITDARGSHQVKVEPLA